MQTPSNAARYGVQAQLRIEGAGGKPLIHRVTGLAFERWNEICLIAETENSAILISEIAEKGRVEDLRMVAIVRNVLTLQRDARVMSIALKRMVPVFVQPIGAQ